jgi:hypothetical protein
MSVARASRPCEYALVIPTRNDGNLRTTMSPQALSIIAAILGWGGAAILLVSVAREKLFMHRKDPYKEIVR